MGDWYKASSKSLSSSQKDDEALPFVSRRSAVLCRHACVASSQPLATSIGLDLLRQGANAAEAAIAVAAALAVTEPCSTGLGGDMFCLYYDAATQRVSAINGSGASPQGLTLERVKQIEPSFQDSPLSVTVPGAARGWEDLLRKHGSGNFAFSQLLEPAALLAEEGFPVAPVTSYHWRSGLSQIAKWCSSDSIHKPLTIPLSVDGSRGPRAGEIIHNPDMARVLRDLGIHGAQKGFYQGTTGKAIVQALQDRGGCMTMDDLAQHTSLFPEPIAAQYRDVKLWQVPPNGQGVASLIALAGLEYLEQTKLVGRSVANAVGTSDWYHVLIEMMRLGFADARAHVACPSVVDSTETTLLNAQRIGSRAEKLFDASRANVAGHPEASSCTVSFQVVDAKGNAISFVQSNYMGFGTGIVPEGCGFTLQNRGFGFSLDPNHPNVVAPNKRPYHTIIPGLITHAESNEFYATLTNMGGFMQPQGHLQLTVDLVAGGLDPQEAIDRPRFCIADGTQSGTVHMEDGIEETVLEDLQAKGHTMQSKVSGHDRSVFGRAQIIQRRGEVLWAGSDGRADGCALGF